MSVASHCGCHCVTVTAHECRCACDYNCECDCVPVTDLADVSVAPTVGVIVCLRLLMWMCLCHNCGCDCVLVTDHADVSVAPTVDEDCDCPCGYVSDYNYGCAHEWTCGCVPVVAIVGVIVSVTANFGKTVCL